MSAPIVLQVLPALETGGVERGTVEITEAIARAGWTALVASAGGPMVREIEGAGGSHLNLPLRTKAPFEILANARRLAEMIRAEHVNIVHARSRAPAWSAWLAARRTGVRFITTYHGAYGEDLPFKRTYNGVMAKGVRVITASRFIADLVMARHKVPRARIRVIPRGVDPGRFDPEAISPERVAQLRAAWELPESAKIILLPGRLTRWKGQRVLLGAAGRLRDSSVHVVLAGSDQGRSAYKAELGKLASSLGLRDRVRLAGECRDMPAALALADVVVHASTEPEAFGRVVIEAQAMARPVIASDLGGPVETVEHGVTGWRVPPGDPAALARAIEAVLEMPEAARHSVARRARETVLARCTTRAMQDATMEVYEEVLGLHHRGCRGGALTP